MIDDDDDNYVHRRSFMSTEFLHIVLEQTSRCTRNNEENHFRNYKLEGARRKILGTI